MIDALTGYDEQGLARLLDAIEHGPPPEPDLDLAEALDASRCAFAAWSAILQQIEQAASWDRGSLGLAGDGFQEDAELTPRQDGARQFLRLLAATMTSRPGLDRMAVDVHHLAWGSDPTEVTWQDVRAVLHGRVDQPDAEVLRTISELAREGLTQRQIVDLLDVTKHQVEAVSTFLGIKAWREESKRRAAAAALEDELTAVELARRYSEVHPGAHAMSERRARELMAEVRGQEAVA